MTLDHYVQNMSDRFSDDIKSLSDIDSVDLNANLQQMKAEIGKSDEIASLIEQMQYQ